MAMIRGLSLAVVAMASATPSLPVSVSVDATNTGKPFEHVWKRSFGSGHAALTLRDDWRAHLKQAAHDLGLQGVRYHGLYDDDQGPVVPSPGIYNFTLLDSTWDYMLSIGVRPIVELSFMPAWLANCSWTGKVGGPTSSSPTITVNPAGPRCRGHTFAYNGISQPPYNDDYTEWTKLVQATVQHCVERYGITEVRKWSFEVWNELWGMPFPTEYMKLYNASSHAVKSVDSEIKVGGPATAGLSNVADFVKAAKAIGAPFDFVSTHHYPSDPSCPRGDDWDPNCFTNDVKRNRATVADYPYFLTEYNVGCCLGWPQHDVPAAAAFVFRQVGELSQDLDLMSYWTFTDVFEEGGFPDVEFKDIYGSMTKSGIPKPVWRAFQLLHTHAGDRVLESTLSNESLQTPPSPSLPSPSPSSSSPLAAHRDHSAHADVWVNEAPPQPLQASCSLVPDTNFNGGDILPESQKFHTPDATTCCEACQNHTGTSPATKCWKWTWGKDNSTCCKNRCYLKQLDGTNTKHDPSMVSGYPGDAPPPPPPPAPKQQLSVFATTNSTSDGLGAVRVFLGFWGNPDQDETNPPANRSVTVMVKHDADVKVAACNVYTIGGAVTQPRALWESMGSPPTPDATQLKALMQESEFGTTTTAVSSESGGSSVTVLLQENMAIVLAFV